MGTSLGLRSFRSSQVKPVGGQGSERVIVTDVLKPDCGLQPLGDFKDPGPGPVQDTLAWAAEAKNYPRGGSDEPRPELEPEAPDSER